MTSCFIGWTITVYALFASQLVLSGVLYPSNEIIQEIGQHDHSGNEQLGRANKNEVNKEKLDEVLQSSLNYDQNKSKLLDDESKNSSTINTSGLTKTDEKSFEDYETTNQPEVFENITRPNNIDTAKNSSGGKVLDAEHLANLPVGSVHFINSNDEINSEDKDITKKLNEIDIVNKNTDVLHNEHLYLQNETGEEHQTKKLNKREYNYYRDSNYGRYYRKTDDHNFGINKPYDNGDYFKWNDNRDEDDEANYKNQHNDDNEDDYDEDVDTGNTDDDEDAELDALVEEILKEDEEMNRELEINKKSADQDSPSDYDENAEAVLMFSRLLDNILTEKLEQMGVDDEELLTPNSDKTQEKIENKNHNNSTIQRIDLNKTKNYEDEIHANSIEKEQRNVRKTNEHLDKDKKDNNSWKNNYNAREMEKEYKSKAALQRPFIVMKSGQDLSDGVNKNNLNASKKLGDAVNDEDKHKLDVNLKPEDEKPLEVKKTIRRNAISPRHFSEFNPPNNEFFFMKGSYDRDGEVNQFYGYSPNFQNNHVSRNVIDKNFQRSSVTDNYSNEASYNKPPFQLMNPKKCDLISVSLNDIFQSNDNIKRNAEYVPDRVTLYLIDNFLQNSANEGNIIEPYNKETALQCSSKIKRDLHNLKDDEGNKENEKCDQQIVDDIVHTLEFLIKSHLSNIQGMPKDLSEFEKDILKDDILYEILDKMSDRRISRQITNGQSDYVDYLQQMNPMQANDNNVINSASGMKRQIDATRCMSSYDYEKPCVTIKNLNIFYEFGDDGKKCGCKNRHYPKRLEPDQSWKVMNYEKRHLVPDRDIGKKNILFNKAADHPIDLLSNLKEVSKRNSIHETNRPIAATGIFRKQGSEYASVSDESDSAIKNLHQTVSHIENEEIQSKTIINNPEIIHNSEPNNFVKSLSHENTSKTSGAINDIPISEENIEYNKNAKNNIETEDLNKKSLEINNNAVKCSVKDKSLCTVNKEGNHKTHESMIDEADETESQFNEGPSDKKVEEEIPVEPIKVSGIEKAASKANNDMGSNYNEFEKNKSNTKPSIEFVKLPLPLMRSDNADKTKISPEVNLPDSMTLDHDNRDTKCIAGPVCYRKSNDQSLDDFSSASEHIKVKTNEELPDETNDTQKQEGIKSIGIELDKKRESRGNGIENKNTESINQGKKLKNVEKKTTGDEDENESQVSVKSPTVVTNEFEEFDGENEDSEKEKLGVTEQSNTNRNKMKTHSKPKSTKEQVINEKRTDHEEIIQDEDYGNKRYVEDPIKFKHSNSKLKTNGANVKRKTDEKGIENKEGSLNEEESIKIKKAGNKKATANSNDYYKKSTNKEKEEKLTEINENHDDDYHHDDDLDVLLVDIDDDDYYHGGADDYFDDDEGPHEDSRMKYNNGKDDKLVYVSKANKYKSYDLTQDRDGKDVRKNGNDKLFEEREQEDIEYDENEEQSTAFKRETSKMKPKNLNKEDKNPIYSEDPDEDEDDEDYDEEEYGDEDDNKEDQEENIKQYHRQKKSKRNDIQEKERKEVKNGNIKYDQKDYNDDDHLDNEYDDEEYENEEEDKHSQKPRNSGIKGKSVRKETTKTSGEDYERHGKEDLEEENEQRKSNKNEKTVKNRVKVDDDNDEDYEYYDEEEQEDDYEENKPKKRTKQDEKSYKLTKENAKVQYSKNNDGKYNDKADVSEVTVFDLPKGLEIKLRNKHSGDEVVEEKEDFRKNQSDDIFNEEFKSTQLMKERKPKSISKSNQRRDDEITNKLDDQPEELEQISDTKYVSKQSGKNLYEDYMKKSDVETIIKDLLESEINTKDTFYNEPQNKYNELLDDIASYFTRKNVQDGDDICIYEEYGTKHGDKDVIYLSGTKLYQNGVPKKDAQNFNLIIRKPHEDIDDILKHIPKTYFREPDHYSRKDDKEVSERKYEDEEYIDTEEEDSKHHKRHIESVNKSASGRQRKQRSYRRSTPHVKTKRKQLKQINRVRR